MNGIQRLQTKSLEKKNIRYSDCDMICGTMCAIREIITYLENLFRIPHGVLECLR
mgnify:CR=1 FL=1